MNASPATTTKAEPAKTGATKTERRERAASPSSNAPDAEREGASGAFYFFIGMLALSLLVLIGALFFT